MSLIDAEGEAVLLAQQGIQLHVPRSQLEGYAEFSFRSMVPSNLSMARDLGGWNDAEAKVDTATLEAGTSTADIDYCRETIFSLHFNITIL